MLARLEILAFAVLAVLATMAGLYWYGRQAGQRAAERAHQERRRKATEKAETVEDEINAMPDRDIRDRLRCWTRA